MKKNMNKKFHKKLWIFMGVILILGLIIFFTSGLPYLKRHYRTVRIDQDKVVSGEKVDFGTDSILTVYFTRVGNSNFDDDVNAVSGASLMLDGEELLGNSQVLAKMIQDAVGGDLYAIETVENYPSSYNDTVNAAGTELREQKRPALSGEPVDLSGYDTIFLVYPLWWGTIPMPLATFLEEYDFEGKTMYPLVTHGGSKFGTSLQDIRALCKAEVSDQGLDIYCDDVPKARESITKWLKSLME